MTITSLLTTMLCNATNRLVTLSPTCADPPCTDSTQKPEPESRATYSMSSETEKYSWILEYLGRVTYLKLGVMPNRIDVTHDLIHDIYFTVLKRAIRSPNDHIVRELANPQSSEARRYLNSLSSYRIARFRGREKKHRPTPIDPALISSILPYSKEDEGKWEQIHSDLERVLKELESIESLSADQKKAYLLKRLSRLTYREVAAELGIKIGQANSWVSKVEHELKLRVSKDS